MTIIWCDYNLFDLHQHIYVVDDKADVKCGAICAVEDIGENIAELCYRYGTNQIMLNGNSLYNKKIMKDIYQYNNLKYSNKIEKFEIKEIKNV